MAIQLGKYKRPGIFMEEYDKSIVTSPTAAEGISTMVIGFSKKGPFNTAVKLNSTNDADSIFGSIDRGLERKSSFFHRTIYKMLESSSVYALNLLLTDDALDTVEYRSMSAATDKLNDSIKTGPYRRFFNTTGFWKRDTETFLELADNNTGWENRVFNITNLSDRYITVFAFKSKLVGYDRTLIEWYGSAEKLPPYLNQNEYASDYMIDILVVGGDWSNYQELSVDNRWASYFNTNGLIKTKIYDFANDPNITVLSFYEGASLIPYFKNSDGKNIFVESLINADTDRTGLFCAFNYDLFETDYPNGLVDLHGNNLVGQEIIDIDFLSYKDTIIEAISFTTKYLDTVGNVTGINPGLLGTTYGEERTGYYSEGVVNGLSFATASYTTGTVSITYVATNPIAPDIADTPYAVIGGNLVEFDAGTYSFTISSSIYPSGGATESSFVSVVVLDTTGTIKIINNTINSDNPSVSATDIVLGYFNIEFGVGVFTDITPNHVTVDGSGFVELESATDYSMTNTGTSSNASFKIEFLSTTGTIYTRDYEKYRRIKMFNHLVSLLDSVNKNKMTMVVDTDGVKKSLSTMTITNIVTSTSYNKSFIINTGLAESVFTDSLLDNNLLLYTLDDEFILGESGATSSYIETKEDIADTTSGVVGKYSDFYTKYLDGYINTGDYFYSNYLTDSQIASTVSFALSGTYSQVTITGLPQIFDIANSFIVPDSVLNTGVFVVNGITGSSTNWTYTLQQEIQVEVLNDINMIYDYDKKNYLKMYFDSTNSLHTYFVDSTSVVTPIEVDLNWLFKVQSEKSNFKQTVEIELPAGYVEYPNKILVNTDRYSEIKIGDFLEAYVDLDLLVDGQMPRNLTRILSKKRWAVDPTYTEISCDARIKKVLYFDDYQTNRYTTIDDYVSTYKAIPLKGFRFREDSLPDGTEARQNAILNLVAKGTPLFKALTNKNAIDYRYLVDCFGLGLTEKSKQQLVDICGDRLDIFGFINMPSIKSFRNSANPTFTDTDGNVSFEFVSKGGDPESSPDFLYSFGDGKGTTATGYFLPYLKINDNGRIIDLPPAMFVASTYMRKHNSTITTITPWTIAAGVTNGRITGISGIETDIPLDGIEWLNQAQMNPIVFKRNRGYVIETENTAQTLYSSALSYIHVREVLVELEKELANMLLDFQWKINTPEIRAEIKLKADIICEQYVSKLGLYNYFNKCDDENNTIDIIDKQMGVLDTYVEPVRGMGIIVNNITILRTGAIQSGGFIN